MAGQVLSFFRRPAAPRNWSTQELAEFYRVEAALIQAGMSVDSERGVTDEGEPWFVFCRAEDDEVVIHFARIDGQYVISAPAYCGTAVGHDFRALVRGVIERDPVLRPKPANNNLFLHPTAFLVVLVTTALLKSGHASAAPPARHGAEADEKLGGAVPATIAIVAAEPLHEALILAAVNAAIVAPLPVMVPMETMTITTALPVAAPASDLTDQPSAPSLNAFLPDQSHQHLPGSGMTPTASAYAPFAATTAGDAVLSLAGAAHDAPPPIPPDWHARPLFDTSPISVVPAATAIDLTASVQHIPLSLVSGLPQAEQALLQAMGVTGAVAFSPSPPAVFSAVIQTGNHIAAGNAQDTHTLSVELAPTAAASAVPSSGTAAAPVPELSVVMANVLAFQAVEVQPVVLLTSNGAIFYDAHAVATDLTQIQSVTYEFPNGFSISLVGLPAELAHAHLTA